MRQRLEKVLSEATGTITQYHVALEADWIRPIVITLQMISDYAKQFSGRGAQQL